MFRKIPGKQYLRGSEGALNKYSTTPITSLPVDLRSSRIEIEFYDDFIAANLTQTNNPLTSDGSKNPSTGDSPDGWYVEGE